MKCSKCKKEKPLSDFQAINSKRLNTWCRYCVDTCSRHRSGIKDAVTAVDCVTRRAIRLPQPADVTKVAAAKRRRSVMVNAIGPQGYIHLSGTGYTEKRDLAWSGTPEQLARLCRTFGHDRSEIRTAHVDSVD